MSVSILELQPNKPLVPTRKSEALLLAAQGGVSLKNKDQRWKRMTPVTKFEGSTGWCDVEVNREAEIDRAVLRSPDELALGFRYEGQAFTVLLRRTRGCEFTGTFTAQPKGEVVSGDVVCRFLHTGSEGLLFGRWKENGVWYRWFAELDVVEHFADEKG